MHLKASNVLVQGIQLLSLFERFEVTVTDYNFSTRFSMVLGTRFWRAPEFLLQLRQRVLIEFTEKCDVYSCGMIYYDLVTGFIPFKNLFSNNYGPILDAYRPTLPHNLHPVLKNVITSFWHPDPSRRPSFQDIVNKHLRNWDKLSIKLALSREECGLQLDDHRMVMSMNHTSTERIKTFIVIW